MTSSIAVPFDYVCIIDLKIVHNLAIERATNDHVHRGPILPDGDLLAMMNWGYRLDEKSRFEHPDRQ